MVAPKLCPTGCYLHGNLDNNCFFKERVSCPQTFRPKGVDYPKHQTLWIPDSPDTGDCEYMREAAGVGVQGLGFRVSGSGV